MLSLLRSSYDNVSEEQFSRDLADKEWAIVGFSPLDEVLAFTTLRRIHIELDGHRVTAFYSGDTVANPGIRGRETYVGVQYLLRTMFAEMERSEEQCSYYWFMISSTFKSHRLLSQLFVDYAPSPLREATHNERAIMSALCDAKGFALDPARSIVAFANPSMPRPELNESSDPAAQFFASRNPGASRGERLASLASLDVANLTPLARKFIFRDQS